MNIVLAVTDFLTQLLLVVVGVFLVFSPQTLIDNVHLGVAPTWKDFFLAIPVGMIAYTGIETISNMAEEAKDETQDDPGGDQPRRDRRLRDLRAAADGRALGAAGDAAGRRHLPDAARRRPRTRAASRATRSWGWSSTWTSARCSSAGEIYVGLLAATILFIATNAGIIGVSRLVYSMGLHRQLPDRLRQLHPQLRHAVDRDHRCSGRSRA